MFDVQVTFQRGNLVLSGELHDGGCICLSGLNGSGKTTFLNVVAGNLSPKAGYVKVGGADVTRLPPERRGVVLVNPDSLIPHLEVERHLRWGAEVKKAPLDGATVAEVKNKLGISFSGRVDRLSLGMRERVSLATALLSKPKAILVDEAFSNIDHRNDFMSAYRDLCAVGGIDLVFTTQQQSEASLADHHYEMVDGRLSRLF